MVVTDDDKQMIVDTFRKFDADGDGVISKEELKRVLNAISKDKGFDDAAVDALMEASDTNKDGSIDYKEFVNWVTKDKESTQEPVSPKSEFKPLDKRGEFHVDYRKFLPERFQVEIAERYDLDKMEIGAGGFGKVFIARDKGMDSRRVAVKKVEKAGGNASSLSDLQKEIEVMKDLDHPNICKLLGTFEEGRNLFFIMELCEGGEVFDRILEAGHISEKSTAAIIGQVSSALAHAHMRGIAHRDIKPENVVFCTKDKADLRVKVIDWGLATSFGSGMNKAVGSMTYAAPEVISSQDRKGYTEACDLWSIGVMTYVMLSGKPPFWGSREQHYKSATKERYPFKDTPWDKMNPQAKDFIEKLLKAQPKKRISIVDACKHPWLLSSTLNDDVDPAEKDSVLANLKCFCAQSTFKRMCITAVARQLDHTHLKDIHQVFRSMDTDGNGVLSYDEISAGFKKMGGDVINQEELAKVFANMDMDGSQSVDYTEFCAAGLGEKTSQCDDVIWAAFKTFDLDNTGFITVENLRTILDSSDVKDVWSADVCREVGSEIVAKFDVDKDGKIKFEEWREIMTACWSTKQAPESPSGAPVGFGAYDILTQVSKLPVGSIGTEDAK